MAPPTAALKQDDKSKPMLAVILLLLSLVAAGMGFAVGATLAPKADSGAAATVAAMPSAGAASAKASVPGTQTAAGEGQIEATSSGANTSLPPLVKVQVPMVILPLPPLLTNLAEPPETWIRFEGSLLMNKDTEDPAPILVEHAGEQILTFLRTIELNQIAGPGGFLNLRDDLNDVVSAASNGQVREVLIHTMVME